MTNLTTNNNQFANLMFAKPQMQSKKTDYPYIKFFNGDGTNIRVIQYEGEGEDRKQKHTNLSSFKARILCKTTVYEYTYADGEIYNILGTSSEMFERKIEDSELEDKFYTRPFFFVNKLTKTIQDDLYKQSDIKLTLEAGQTIKRKDVLYLDVEEFGICKTYLRLTQTIGKVKKGNNYEFQRKEPIKDGIEDILKAFGPMICDYVFTIEAKSYKSGPTSTTVYPVFINPEEQLNPDVQSTQSEIFMNIYNANKALYENNEVVETKTETVFESAKIVDRRGDDVDLPF